MNVINSGAPRQRFVWATRWPPTPPNFGGDAVYCWGLIRALATVADVDIVAFSSGDGKPVQMPGLAWHILPAPTLPPWLSVPAPLPNIAFQHRSKAYLARLIELARGADAVFLDQLGIFWAAEGLRAARERGEFAAKLILVTHNQEGKLRAEMPNFVGNPVMRFALMWDARKSARLESRALALADGATAISEEDVEGFRADLPRLPILLLTPTYDGEVVAERQLDSQVPLRVCLLAGRGSFHKQLVLIEALKGLATLPAQSGITVEVVGAMDAEMKERLSRENPGIVFRGFVDDFGTYLQTVRVAILPDVVGGGFKMRALTLAHQRVPMAAVRGALTGSGLTPGVDFAEYDDIPTLVAGLLTLVPDEARLNALQDSAFRRMNGQYAPAARAEALRQFVMRLSAEPGAAAPAISPALAPSA